MTTTTPSTEPAVVFELTGDTVIITADGLRLTRTIHTSSQAQAKPLPLDDVVEATSHLQSGIYTPASRFFPGTVDFGEALPKADWNQTRTNSEQVDFTAFLTELRHEHPVFRRRRFLRGGPIGTETDDRDIAWLTYKGRVMTTDDWNFDFGKSLMVWLNGDAITERDQRGHKIEDDSFLLCFNAHHEDIVFQIPGTEYANSWEILIDTAEITGRPDRERIVEPEGELRVPARSTIVLIERH